MAESNITSAGTGDWNAGATWTGGAVPDTDQHAIIQSGHNVTINADDEVKSLSVQGGGTLTGNSSYSITVNGEGNATYGTNHYAIDLDGVIGTNVKLILTYNGTTALDLAGSSGTVNSLTINHADCVANLETTGSLAGDLTITAGEFKTNNNALTVTGNTSLGAGAGAGGADEATLTCGSSTVSLGSTYSSDYGLYVKRGGTFVGGTGAHTMGSISMEDYATAKLTLTTHANGTTLNAGDYGSDYIVAVGADSTITSTNSLLVLATSKTEATYNLNLHNKFNNLTVNSSGKKFYIQQATTLAGDLTITAGDVDTTGSNHALTVADVVTVNGSLTGNGSTLLFGSLKGTGTFNAPTTTVTIDDRDESTGKALDIDGMTISTNDLNVTLTSAKNQDLDIGDDKIHDLTINNDTDARINYFTANGSIDGDLTITRGILNTFNRTLTVDGDCSIAADGKLEANVNGNVAVTLGSLTIASGGIYNATSATTTITSMTSTGSGDRSLSLVSGGTFTNTSGTVLFNSGADQRLQMAGTGNLYNLTVNKSDNEFITFGNLTILNNLDVTLAADHTWRPNAGSDTLTVYGNTYLTTGKIGNTTQYTGTNNWGNVTINSGEFILSTGTNNVSGIRNVGGTVSQS